MGFGSLPICRIFSSPWISGSDFKLISLQTTLWLCRGPNASNPARGRTLPGQERPSNGRPDASQMRPGSMLCPVGLPGALSVDILALLLYWTTYAPITVRLTSDTHVAYWQWRPEQISVKLEGQIGINMTFSVKKKCFCMRDIIIIFWGATAMHYLMHRFGIF